MIAMRRCLMGLLLATLLMTLGCTPPHVYRDRGVAAYERGDLVEAKQNFAMCLQGDPTNRVCHYHIGLIALEQDEPAEARRHLEIAYALTRDSKRYEYYSPDLPDALAEALFRQGNYPKLVGFCEELIAESGKVADYLRLARYMHRMGDPDSAVVVYRKAARIAPPDDPSPYVAMADFYEALGQTDLALEALRRAYGINPDNAEIAGRIRSYGLVPGPTVALPIER
jgi:tetratricopeptide (TPR) repeat protein